MGTIKAWVAVARPRYGIIHVAAAMGVILLVAWWSWRATVDRIMAAVAATGLPPVRLAETGPRLGTAAYRQPYEFTEDWFTYDIPVWEAALSSYRGKPGVHYLEVGAFEGGSLLWMVENILTGPNSHATAIDVFSGDVEHRYRANVERSGAAGRIATIKAPSQVALRSLPLDSFDVIYIDGSHAMADVLEDAVLSWRLLKPGGLLIFDDYQWIGALQGDAMAGDSDTDWPKPAIDAFCRCFAPQVEVLHNANQLILRKRS